jgi:hypothetical protein
VIRFRFAAAAALLLASAAHADSARIDMNESRRAVAREDNLRIDAQLMEEIVAPNTPISITYQIENLGNTAVAVADKVAETTYDLDSQTITFSIGAEIPTGANMPHLVTIVPGEKRVLRTGAMSAVVVSKRDTAWSVVPRFVQIKVNVLRNLEPFAKLIERQRASAAPVALPNDVFEHWVESNDAIFLNTLPVRWQPRSNQPGSEADASRGGW